MAAPTKKVIAPAGPNFLDPEFYSGGFLLAPGLYAMEHNLVLHAFTDKDGNTRGEPRLGVMLNATPINEAGEATGAPIPQFISMGTKAHLSYVPNESGKGLEAVSGGPGQVSNKANWFYYLESMLNCGMPKGLPDLTEMDGVWVRTDNIPEPEERKGFASTGEVEGQKKAASKMPVVTEILDGGKPWEGTGGIPEAGAAPAPKTKVAGKIAPKAAAAKAAPAAAAPAEMDESILTAATNGLAAVLTKAQNAKGIVKLMLKTGTFKAVKEAESDEVANAVIETFFGADETALASLLGELDFKIEGTRISPA